MAKNNESGALNFLYNNAFGRVVLKLGHHYREPEVRERALARGRGPHEEPLEADPRRADHGGHRGRSHDQLRDHRR